MVSKEDVRNRLEEVIDPELDINIVDLGLVYEIEVEGGTASILMTLTTPGCPLHAMFEDLVEEEVKELDGIDEVEVELTFEPKWEPSMMSEEARDKIGPIPGQGF